MTVRVAVVDAEKDGKNTKIISWNPPLPRRIANILVGGVDGLLGGDQDLVEEEEATKGGKVLVLLDHHRPGTRNTREGNEIETEKEGLDRLLPLPSVVIDEETAQELALDLTGEDTIITAETFTRIGRGDHQFFPRLM